MAGILRRLTGRGAPAERAEAPGTLELRGTGTRALFVPARTGRIGALEIGSREWLRPGGAVEELGLTTGDGAAGPLDAEVAVETTPGGNVATHVWRSATDGSRLERRVRVAPSGEVEMRYAAANDGASRAPFRWSAEALLPLSAGTRLLVTEGTPIRVGDAQGIALGAPGAEHRWPHARLAKSIADLSRPARVARKYLAELWLQMKDGRIGIEEEGLRLEIAFDPVLLPAVRLRVNHRGARIGAERAPEALGVAVASGIPGEVTGAVAGREGAGWLEPGERREWTVTWSAHPVGAPPPPR